MKISSSTQLIWSYSTKHKLRVTEWVINFFLTLDFNNFLENEQDQEIQRVWIVTINHEQFKCIKVTFCC